MNSEVALILTAGGIIGAIITTQLWQMNWFKRENFKLHKSNILAENRIKIKKLEKDLGISKGRSKSEPTENKGLLESLAGLDLDKIQGLLSLIQKDEDIAEPTAGSALMNGIMEFAKNNPEAVQQFLGKIKPDDTDSENSTLFDN